MYSYLFFIGILIISWTHFNGILYKRPQTASYRGSSVL